MQDLRRFLIFQPLTKDIDYKGKETITENFNLCRLDKVHPDFYTFYWILAISLYLSSESYLELSSSKNAFTQWLVIPPRIFLHTRPHNEMYYKEHTAAEYNMTLYAISMYEILQYV